MATPAPPQPAPPQEVYGVFCGAIDAASTQRIFSSMATATNPALSVTHVHLLFQTSGGLVGDGVALYNFFKAYPLPLTIYTGSGGFNDASVDRDRFWSLGNTTLACAKE